MNKNTLLEMLAQRESDSEIPGVKGGTLYSACCVLLMCLVFIVSMIAHLLGGLL